MLLLLWLLLPTACEREQVRKPDVEILSAVMPALAPGQTTAAIYLSLVNNTHDVLVINHIEASVSDHIEVHRVFYEEGMMKMRPVAHVRVEPDTKMQFSPGGYHLMVFDLVGDITRGDAFDLTIHFNGGKSVTGSVNVRPLAL